MNAIQAIGLMMGSSWAAGINLYASVFMLGISQKFEWVDLPESMSALDSWPVILIAAALYTVEFIVDKIPGLDSLNDTVHTFIRPIGGAALAYMAIGDTAPQFQVISALIGGFLSLESHTTKASVRAVTNLSPEPVTNIASSVGEDVAAFSLVALAMTHPVITIVVVLVLVVAAVFIIRWAIRTVRRAGKAIKGFLQKRKAQKREANTASDDAG